MISMIGCMRISSSMFEKMELHMNMKKIILDTDLGGDCDDVGAVAVLCNLAKQGAADILAVTYCIGNPWGAYFVQYELEYYGYFDVPVGSLKTSDFMCDDVPYAKYTRPYVESYHVPKTETEDAVRVLRRALANNEGMADITLVAIGPLRNIANLLRSPADDISPKSGRELVRENVEEFVTMLGCISNTEMCEWNVEMDIPSAQYCVEQMPVPIIFSPFELGDHIQTGNLLASVPDSHPVKAAYLLHADGKCHTRCSWDLITVYCAVHADTPLYERIPLHAAIRDNGCFDVTEGDDMMYLRQRADDTAVQRVIDPLML